MKINPFVDCPIIKTSIKLICLGKGSLDVEHKLQLLEI